MEVPRNIDTSEYASRILTEWMLKTSQISQGGDTVSSAQKVVIILLCTAKETLILLVEEVCTGIKALDPIRGVKGLLKGNRGSSSIYIQERTLWTCSQVYLLAFTGVSRKILGKVIPMLGTDKAKITKKTIKMDKHGHEERKSTKEAGDSIAKGQKVNQWSNSSQLLVNKSQTLKDK
ncbi:hypothetical protein Tco_0563198 [Tanacetum coccineum]